MLASKLMGLFDLVERTEDSDELLMASVETSVPLDLMDSEDSLELMDLTAVLKLEDDVVNLLDFVEPMLRFDFRSPCCPSSSFPVAILSLSPPTLMDISSLETTDGKGDGAVITSQNDTGNGRLNRPLPGANQSMVVVSSRRCPLHPFGYPHSPAQ